MDDKILCNKCKKGYIKVSRVCKLRWKVECSDCNYKEIMYYPQLVGFVQNELINLKQVKL